MNGDVLIQIRRAVRQKRYQMTDHALEEADADNISLDDIIGVLLNGNLDSTFTDDPRGPRYVIRGDVAQDEVDVVAVFAATAGC